MRSVIFLKFCLEMFSKYQTKFESLGCILGRFQQQSTRVSESALPLGVARGGGRRKMESPILKTKESIIVDLIAKVVIIWA